MKKHIPNTITLLNLISGCVACVMALDNHYFGALVFIIIASVFDFFDGLSARLLKAYSKLGKELDSLADVVSFGVAPGMIIFVFLRNTILDYYTVSLLTYIAYIAFLIPAFSAYRLAKFNIDERQTSSFIGLPTPANALFICSLAFSHPLAAFTGNVVFLMAITVVFSLLLVCELPLFSLKFKSFDWKSNKTRYLFIILSTFILIIFQWGGFAFVIVLYIILSIFTNIFSNRTVSINT